MKLATTAQAIFLAVLLLSSPAWAGYSCAHCGGSESDLSVRHPFDEWDTCGFDIGNKNFCPRPCRKMHTYCKPCQNWTGRNVKDAALECKHYPHYYRIDIETKTRQAPLFPKRAQGRPPKGETDAGKRRRRGGPVQQPANEGDAPTPAADGSTSYVGRPRKGETDAGKRRRRGGPVQQPANEGDAPTPAADESTSYEGRPRKGETDAGNRRRRGGPVQQPTNEEDASTSAADESTSYAPGVYFEFL
ncbi:hypothetical protein PTTG_29231 [Puccinia triticina 1-1 BBBD Race 1]|uniref:Uncharacterized protein n=2 Tax=Puccinia triticina TaxID=208348 RepID=A0A180G5R1_PUCT1|nr:uncharacterized protein PtA15_12A171 [Puccinia triticina]OAV87934.1 hypothetical protein PTTG_29231 [Puccinia triticina 1-1 BBBD Race 1]WAQ90185.1 hypothetical protein PtA15_12A171 [Puccinia triticina]WAR61475.1 hypothetical protein PtB15_12B160 [Puccinia triticina]